MASRIRQQTIASAGWTPMVMPVSASEAQLRIPSDAGAAVNIREDPADSTTQDTLQPGESYRSRSTARGQRVDVDAVLCWAQAQSGTVTGILLCYDD